VKPLLAVLGLGIAAPMIQGGAGKLLPASLCPDLGLLLVVAIGLSWRSTAGGLLLASGLGFVTDLLSGSLLGQHALLRVFAYGAARIGARQLNLRGALPQAMFVACLTVANALVLLALTAFFAPGSAVWVPPSELLTQAAVNALLAPPVAAGVAALIGRLGDEEGGRRLLRLEPRNWTA
jgi:rod shape-determining protein MreD